MKTMHKLFALLLALSLVLSMALSVSATTPDPYAAAPTAVTDTGTITILGAASGTQYTIYRIFDIAKTTDGDNVYVVNDKWRAFAEAESAKADGYFTISNDYLKTVDIPGADDAAKAQLFAEYVMDYAKNNGITFDGQSAVLTTSGDYTAAAYPYGYYVMVSDRATAEDVKYSVFVLDQPNVEVYEKNTSQASIHKYVQEDSEASDPNTQGWGESNAAEIAQMVSFKIVITAAAGTDTYVVTDTMPNFEGITDVSYVYSRGNIATNGLTFAETADGFTVTFGETFRTLIEDGDTIEIHYKAKLKSSAVIAGDGNENTVVLTGGGEKIGEDSTKTYTYKLDVTKVDETETALAGATFTLSHQGNQLKFDADPANANNYIVNPNGAVSSITTDASGKFSISGLDTEDLYVLEETAAPEGYILMDPVNITIQADGSHTHSITVQNLPGVDVPETGGMGTTLFYAVGGIMVLAAVVLLVTKKRMSA